eukprot:scaffold1390_cov138-Cylindrotheca_fusiformis.AAC.5
MTRIRSAFYFQCALCYLAGFAYGQFCTSLKSNTWAGFVQAVTDSSQNGLATLCPFEISGDGCPSQEEYPNGLIINDETEIYVSCDPFLYGFNTDTECIIDCPGRHITVSELSSLTLERFVLSGATNSSIMVEEGGSVTVINTIFKDNVVNGEIGNGGAIYSSIHSTAKVKYSQFLRNEAVYGGAIYGSQESTVEVIESKFADNQALIAGGAYANDVYASARFENVNFNVNEASSGGALYLATYSTTQLLSNNLYKNIAFNGGAIFDGGSTNIYDSVFNENKAEDSGGAIYVDAGSSTALYRTELVNNRAGNAGPAVNNRYSTVVNAVNNTACDTGSGQISSPQPSAYTVGSTPSPSTGPTWMPSASPTFRPSRPLTMSPSPNPTTPPPVFWSTKFPLPLCAGDCDADRDCEDGLVCFQRGAYEVVPGCSGGSENESQTDFCIRDPSRPTSPPDTPLPSDEPTRFVSSAPTTAQPTFGDSSTWTPSASPSQFPSDTPSLRDSTSPTISPSHLPTSRESEQPTLLDDTETPTSASAGPTRIPSMSPTFPPSRPLTASPSPNPTNPPPVFWSTKFPLPLCAGDCDADRDCEDGLICFQRGANDAVPGCSGGRENDSKTDFCIRDPSRRTSPPATPLPSHEPTGFVSSQPTTMQPSIATQQPTTPPSEVVSVPSTKPSLRGSSSPTLQPSNQPIVEALPLSWGRRFPLNRCEGTSNIMNAKEIWYAFREVRTRKFQVVTAEPRMTVELITAFIQAIPIATKQAERQYLTLMTVRSPAALSTI